MPSVDPSDTTTVSTSPSNVSAASPPAHAMEALATIEGGDATLTLGTSSQLLSSTPLTTVRAHVRRWSSIPERSADDTDFVRQIEEHPPTKHPVHSTLTGRSDRGGE